MKKLLSFIVLFFIGFLLFAQAPQKFTYQAVVRDAGNGLVSSQAVGVRISILLGGANGSVVYQETHTAVTNVNGLMTLQVGGGIVQNGDFAAIDWANGTYFLHTEIDPTGGTNYTVEGTQQLLSVPYALYAGNAANSFSGSYNDLTDQPTIPAVPTNVSAFNNDAGYITMDSVPVIPTNVSTFENDAGYITVNSIPDIPTNVSSFTNDANYITLEQVPSQVNSDWNATSGVAQIMNKPSIPSIPTTISSFQNDMNYVTQSVMNDTLANFATLNSIPTIPTNVSYFYNDANYITLTQVPEQVNSDWNATSGAAKILNKPSIPSVPTNVSVFNNDAHYITDVQLQGILNNVYHTIDSLEDVISNLNLQLNPTLGTVITNTAIEISYTTIICGGNVISNGGTNILAAGMCYSTSTVPSLADNVTIDSYIRGDFSSTLTGLTAGTTYYVRAYVTTEMGTAYGEVLNFTTLANDRPVVITSAVSEVLAGSAVCGGNVLSDGGLAVTARGICYSSTNPIPTMDDDVTIDGTGMGEFTTTILGLNSVTTYYIRAYATNALGTTYGEVISFTTIVPTAPVVYTNPVTDILPHTATLHGEVVSSGGVMLSSRGFCYGTSHDPTIEGEHTNDGTISGVFEHTITTLSPTTTYYVRAYATNLVGTVYGEETSFTSSTTPPGVTTNEVTNITQTSASCGGVVTYAGGAAVIAKGLCYSTSENPTIENSTIVSGTGVGAFTGELTGLMSNTTYHVRAFATNDVGTDYGEERVFTTLPFLIPSIEAVGATDITYYSFTCGGNVTDSGTYAVTARGLCYSSTPNPTISNQYIALGTGTGVFSYTFTDLAPNTTLYVRAYAINAVGIAYSEQMAISTLAYSAPVVATVSANVSGVCIGNIISSGGLDVTNCGFCYSTYPNPTIYDNFISTNNETDTFSTTLPNLVVGSTYYVKAYASNDLGTSYGEQVSFTHAVMPTVTTTAVSSIAGTTATSGGNVTSDGGATVTARGVCWSTSHNPTTSDDKTTDSVGIGIFSSNLVALALGTTYYVRAYATNDAGTAYGNEESFHTLALPTVTTTAISDIAINRASSGGNVTNDGGAPVTARGVCWSMSPSPTISDSKTINGSGTGTFTSSLTGLSSSTNYYVRAYATNSEGTAYGAVRSFRTALPTLPTPSVTVNQSDNNYFTFTIRTPGVSGVKYYIQYRTGESCSCSNTTDPSTSNYIWCPTGQGLDSSAQASINLAYSVLVFKIIGTKSGYNNSSVWCYEGYWH